MAPEVALAAVRRITKRRGLVLDPMCGSGTVLSAALAHGHDAIGFDVDPLSVLMSRVRTDAYRGTTLVRRAEEAVRRARHRSSSLPPWITRDPETVDFVEYWFDVPQQDDLSRLSRELLTLDGSSARALRLALSRTIITKDSGASLARDTSHSRPHRVKDTNSFDVFAGFVRAASQIAAALAARKMKGRSSVRTGDARALSHVADGSADLVVTSPPYLNAIDYMRGHRLALIWLGWDLPTLRTIRAEAVGAERAATNAEWHKEAVRRARRSAQKRKLSSRQQNILERYILDVAAIADEVARVLRRGAHVVWVIGNSNVEGRFINNARIVRAASERAGLQLVDRTVRPIPKSARYLPPPTELGSDLSKRLLNEVVLTMGKPTRRG